MILQKLARWRHRRKIISIPFTVAISDVPASAAYFGGYEIIQRAMVYYGGGDRSDLGVGRTLLAGGLAGVCNWIVALPPDVLKSRLQSGNLR